MKNESKHPEVLDHDEVLVLTNIIKFLVPQASTNHSYAIFEESVPPLGGPPPHAHPDEEVFYILEGEFEFALNDLTNPFKATAGSVVHVPSNAVHTFKNVGETPGKMVVIITPGNLEKYFREIGVALETPDKRPNLCLVPDFAKMDISRALQLAPEHNIRFILPETVN